MDSTPFANPHSIRYQQVYDASQFSAISDGGAWIKQIAFRDDGDCLFSFGATISNLQINLSTTPRVPDGLSSIFSENVGVDDTVVVGPRSVQLLGVCSRGMRPQPFGILFGFNTPFYYDPNAGNLLLDIRNISGATSFFGALDAEFTSGDSMSQAFTLDVNAASATFVASAGLITVFTVQPLPRLHLSLAWSNLLFRWVNHPGCWTLQQSPTVGLGSAWQLAGGTATTNGAYKEVTLPLDTNTASMFFRLVLPPPPQERAIVRTGNATIADSKPKR